MSRPHRSLEEDPGVFVSDIHRSIPGHSMGDALTIGFQTEKNRLRVLPNPQALPRTRTPHKGVAKLQSRARRVRVTPDSPHLLHASGVGKELPGHANDPPASNGGRGCDGREDHFPLREIRSASSYQATCLEDGAESGRYDLARRPLVGIQKDGA